MRRSVDLDPRHVILHRDRHLPISCMRHLALPSCLNRAPRVRAYRMAKFPVLLKAIPLAKNPAPRSIFVTHIGWEESMDFAITEEHRMMVDSVRQFREKELMPLEKE